jgi:hypothetical protein
MLPADWLPMVPRGGCAETSRRDIALPSNSHRLYHVEEQLDVRQYPRIRPVAPILRQSDLRESNLSPRERGTG